MPDFRLMITGLGCDKCRFAIVTIDFGIAVFIHSFRAPRVQLRFSIDARTHSREKENVQPAERPFPGQRDLFLSFPVSSISFLTASCERMKESQQHPTGHGCRRTAF
jgi:hypothetical protein